MSVQTDEIALFESDCSHLGQINRTPRAKVIAILDNTDQPALIQASRHACVKICSMIINKFMYVLLHILLRTTLLLKARVVKVCSQQ